MTVSVPYEFENGTPGDATEVNANFAAVAEAFDDYLPLVGGTLTGALVLPNSDPTLNNQAARKKYVDDAIAANVVADGSITAAKLAADAVTTAKILDTNVTTAKIADDAVTAAKIAADAVETAGIKDANVTLAKIANEAGSVFTCTAKRNATTLASTTGYASYERRGRWVKGYCMVTLNATAAGAGDFHIFTNLPAPADTGAVCGAGVYLNQGAAFYTLSVLVQTDNFTFMRDGEGDHFGNAFTVANTDYIKFEFEYEAAS